MKATFSNTPDLSKELFVFLEKRKEILRIRKWFKAVPQLMITMKAF